LVVDLQHITYYEHKFSPSFITNWDNFTHLIFLKVKPYFGSSQDKALIKDQLKNKKLLDYIGQ